MKDKFIRNVKIIERPKQTGIPSFVRDVWSAFQEHLNAQQRNSSKLVIRCENSHDIQVICDEFRTLGVESIGIHENFKNNPRKPWLVQKVPDPNKTAEKVWVHQNKLLEGVDSAAFRVASVYKEMGSVRSLVQQIGRIIRNPGQKPGQNAFFLDYQGGTFKRMWSGFLEYDKNITPSSLTLSLPVRINKTYNETLPKLEYFDKSFRKLFDLSSISDPYSEFRLPKSTYITRWALSCFERIYIVG